MTLHQTNLWTALLWKNNQWKYRNKFGGSTKIYLSDCGVRLPHWALITQGIKGLAAGWNHHNKFFNLTRPAASTHAIGRQTRADLDAGWGASSALADQIRRTKISASSQQCWVQSERDNNHDRFGIQELYSRLVFARHWHQRKVTGWSGRAFLLLVEPNRERKDYRGWSCGCPEWYASHQP
tara:strand:+ start:731 stop:1273 length:543 start_codon:yes stop_codon:yes gene_type:complete